MRERAGEGLDGGIIPEVVVAVVSNIPLKMFNLSLFVLVCISLMMTSSLLEKTVDTDLAFELLKLDPQQFKSEIIMMVPNTSIPHAHMASRLSSLPCGIY